MNNKNNEGTLENIKLTSCDNILYNSDFDICSLSLSVLSITKIKNWKAKQNSTLDSTKI